MLGWVGSRCSIRMEAMPVPLGSAPSNLPKHPGRQPKRRARRPGNYQPHAPHRAAAMNAGSGVSEPVGPVAELVLS